MSETGRRSRAVPGIHEVISQLEQEELKARKTKELIRLYRQRQRRLWRSKAELGMKKLRYASYIGLILVGTFVLGVVVVWAGYQLSPRKLPAKSSNALGATVVADFNPVIPRAFNQTLTTAQNNSGKIVSYQDSSSGANLTVSQQKLPASFRTDPGAIAKLDQFKAASALDTPKGKLYVATNTTGQQWAAMALGDVLLFINSSKTLDPASWQKYIGSLQPR